MGRAVSWKGATGLLQRTATGRHGGTAASVRRGSPNVVQYGPNTRQNGGAGGTKDQHETTRCPTPLNLQNLHPRFKSGRRLHFSEQNRSFASREGERTLSNWTTVDYSPQPPAANSRRKPLLQRALLVRAVDKGRGPRTSIIRCSARNELPDRHTPRGLPGSPRYATIRPCDVGATIRRRWNSVRRWTDGSASCHGSACSCWRACSRYRPYKGIAQCSGSHRRSSSRPRCRFGCCEQRTTRSPTRTGVFAAGRCAGACLWPTCARSGRRGTHCRVPLCRSIACASSTATRWPSWCRPTTRKASSVRSEHAPRDWHV